MAKRFIETTIWTQNKWYRKLSPKHKLLWIFLITNCDAVGVWEEDMELVCFLIGDEYTKDDLKVFEDRIEFMNQKKIWIVDFCKFQYGVLSELSRPHQSFMKLLKNHGLLERVQVQDKSNTANAIRKRLTQTKKEEILSKYKYECQYCGATGIEMIVDHITPISHSGDNEDENLICACSDCNIKKHDLTLSAFYDKYRVSKNLDRVCKIINSLKEQDKDKGKDKGKEKRKSGKKIKELFNKIYNDYPRKLGKDDALKHFSTQYESSKDVNKFMADIEKALINYKAICIKKGTETDYILHASTFFNKRWKDFVDYSDEKPAKKVETKQTKTIFDDKKKLKEVEDLKNNPENKEKIRKLIAESLKK